MDTSTYYTTVNIKTINGYVEIGRFDLGTDLFEAKSVFEDLKGQLHDTSNSKLRLEFIEYTGGIPVLLSRRNCSLIELSDNIRRITTLLFRRYNIDPT